MVGTKAGDDRRQLLPHVGNRRVVLLGLIEQKQEDRSDDDHDDLKGAIREDVGGAWLRGGVFLLISRSARQLRRRSWQRQSRSCPHGSTTGAPAL